MNFRIRTSVAALLAISLVASYAYGSDPAPKTKKPVARRAATPSAPNVQEQIQELRNELQGQIDSLKNDLAAKDAQLQQAQQAAAQAQDAAAKAEAAASAQQQAVTENAAAVTTLQSTVTDLKANNVSLATTISDETASIKKAIASPDALQYKGITLSPAGSFTAAETVWRSAATGGGLNTQFTGVPLQYSGASKLTEFQGSGRQSRVTLKATGKLDYMTMTGYYEADWLGTGITSNNNQSNSYVLRQRQIWGQAALTNGWTFTGGQMWSLATETTKGLSNGSEILPATIDPQYEAGFVWTRQYGFRVTKAINNKVFIGASAENAETLNPSGAIVLNSGTTVLLGSGGNGGGLYNSTSNYSFNIAPDFVAKIAFEPGWGHWELFNITRFFRDRIYYTGFSPFNDSEVGSGFGGSFRGTFDKKVTVGLKGLYGTGVGRYGSSTIADITLDPDGRISPLPGFSALSTVEVAATPRLSLYFNYGGDYIYRDILSTTANVGYGNRLANMSGCKTEVPATTTYTNSGTGFGNSSNPANCAGNTKDVQEGTAGYWYNIYSGPKGRLRQGIQYSYFARNLWSGAGGASNLSNSAVGKDGEVYTSFRYYLP